MADDADDVLQHIVPDYDPDFDDDDEWCDTCQGLGSVDCLCGGDLCVCLNYGERPCPDCDRAV